MYLQRNLSPHSSPRLASHLTPPLIFLLIAGSLQTVLQKYGALNDKILKNYLVQILEGLEYLHAHRVVHRDIKSANVLVDTNGVCKLTDFGSAKRILKRENDNTQKKVVGTVQWMAPEVIKSQEAGRFSDIWSLGCTILEMATGKLPYYQYDNQLTAMFQIGKNMQPPEIPTTISKQLRNLLEQCFE